MVGGESSQHKITISRRSKHRFQFRANEPTVDVFHNFTLSKQRFSPFHEGETRCILSERTASFLRSMANMNDRRVDVTPVVQQNLSVDFELRVVSSTPYWIFKPKLTVDENQRSDHGLPNQPVLLRAMAVDPTLGGHIVLKRWQRFTHNSLGTGVWSMCKKAYTAHHVTISHE